MYGYLPGHSNPPLSGDGQPHWRVLSLNSPVSCGKHVVYSPHPHQSPSTVKKQPIKVNIPFLVPRLRYPSCKLQREITNHNVLYQNLIDIAARIFYIWQGLNSSLINLSVTHYVTGNDNVSINVTYLRRSGGRCKVGMIWSVLHPYALCSTNDISTCNDLKNAKYG